jgi:hypothetical protein
MTQHAYMAYLPTVTFGPGMQSATEIRTAWPELDDRRRMALVMSLYPHTQKNPKLAKTVVKMLDTAMGTQMAEATGDERFDNIMSRIRQEPTIPDAQMPPTDVKDLYHWAVKHHKPYHKIFAKWANREGYKSVAPALQKAGNLDSDALDYWTPDVWKLWFGPDAEMPRHWSKERVPDELRDYLEGVFDAYENIWQDWPNEYRQIGDRGVNEATEHNNPTADKIFFARSKIAPKSWRYDHVGFITQDGRQIQMSGHRDNDVYVTNTVSDDPEFPEQHIKIVSLPKPVSVPTTNTVGAENCGTFVANVLQANGIKGIDIHKLYKIFKQPRKQGMDEEVTRQMSQGGLRASYQAKYNQPMMEDYLDEARS